MPLKTYQAIQVVKDLLKTNMDIFDPLYIKEIYGNPERILSGEGHITFCYPKRISPNTIDGFRLKGNKGFISISETYRYTSSQSNDEVELVGYVYRYITSEMTYSCNYSNSGLKKKDGIPYSFHYDWDFKFKPDNSHQSITHPDKHLQVIHPHPRFKTETMTVEDFLMLIKTMAFNKKGKPIPKPFFVFPISI